MMWSYFSLPDPQRTHVMWGMSKVRAVLNAAWAPHCETFNITPDGAINIFSYCVLVFKVFFFFLYTVSFLGLCNVRNQNRSSVQWEHRPCGGYGQALPVSWYFWNYPAPGGTAASGQRYTADESVAYAEKTFCSWKIVKKAVRKCNKLCVHGAHSLFRLCFKFIPRLLFVIHDAQVFTCDSCPSFFSCLKYSVFIFECKKHTEAYTVHQVN